MYFIVKNQDIAETPLYRYKRLEIELSELKKDLLNMEKFASEEDKQTLINFNPVDLSKQVENLQKEINSLHLQKIGARVDASKLDNKTRKYRFISLLAKLLKSLIQIN